MKGAVAIIPEEWSSPKNPSRKGRHLHGYLHPPMLYHFEVRTDAALQADLRPLATT